MKIELTIKTSYLPEWGAYEGIRELIQNGKDAETEFGAGFEVRYRRDTSTLVIENEGAVIPHEALLFGHTTKSGNAGLIGKFGEGLKLGMLALVRAGHDVKIRSGSEVWVPKIERSDRFDAEVLTVHIEGGREPKNRVQVEIGGIAPEEWEEFHSHFLFLSRLGKDQAIKTHSGTLLLGEQFKQKVYVKGIYVQRSNDFSFGYDLTTASVDRDRKMVDSFDLNFATAEIWRLAMATRPDLIDSYISLLVGDAADVRGVNEFNAARLPEEVKAKVAQQFTERHGESALPVPSLLESQDVEHLGKKGVIVPKPLRAVLEEKFGNVFDNKRKLAQETVRLYGWHEMDDVEKANLERAMFLVNGVTPVTLIDIDVADFRDPKVSGLFSPATGRIQLAKKILHDRDLTLRFLVHETAHKLGGRDGEHDHVVNIEKLWTGIVARLTDKVN
jgi:hypothetical protein